MLLLQGNPVSSSMGLRLVMISITDLHSIIYNATTAPTFSELSEGEGWLDVFHGGGLESLGVVGHNVGLKRVDEVAHNMDEDPICVNSMMLEIW